MNRVELIILGNIKKPIPEIYEKLDEVLSNFKDNSVELVTNTIGVLYKYLHSYAVNNEYTRPRIYKVESSRALSTEKMIKDSLDRGDTIMVLFKTGHAVDLDLYIKIALQFNIKIMYVEV